MGIIIATLGLGLFTASAAHADGYSQGGGWVYRQPARRYARVPQRRWVFSHGRRYWQPTYAQPTYVQPTYVQPTYVQPTYVQPTYVQPTYAQPVYTQPQYPQPYDDGCGAFTNQVRTELGNMEEQVRARVAAGQLDGGALTTMEAARDDLLRDLQDLSAKGYFTDADRGHVESDIQQLRARFGC
jgi:hypothetical protein